MNAHTAQPSATTLRISNTATATPADSSTFQRIDDFIKAQFAKAGSADFSGVKASGERASRLGFTSSANSRYADFLEAFRSTPHLAAEYATHYPQCCFLPWPAFHAVRKSLNLWCELPAFYAGAVPDEQLPWLEVFELRKEDSVKHSDAERLLGRELHDTVIRCFDPVLERDTLTIPKNRDLRVETFRRTWISNDQAAGFLTASLAEGERKQKRTQLIIDSYTATFRDSFFVVAPPEAFSTTGDWISRFDKLVTDAERRLTEAPNDPLVIRFVHGGALVVAAWGDEAAALNQATRDLKI